MSQIIKKITYLAIGLGFSTAVVAENDLYAALALSDFNLPKFDEYSVPVVLTATRLQQHQADVPASVTILDENFIKQVSAQNLAELFRFVPGMIVGPDQQYNSDSVHYHGGPAALPKNMQVLVNGRSMYRSGLAAVSWYEVPVAMEDIKRIEVVRGPNAATYGANSYQAIVNILTKHPADTYGSTVLIQQGNNGEENVYLKHGGHIGKSDYRISFTQKRTDNFISEEDEKTSQFFNIEHYYQSNDLGEFETSIVVSEATRDLDSSIEQQVNDNQLTENRIELGSIWTKDVSAKHQLKVKGYYIQSLQDQKIQVAGVPAFILDDDLRALHDLNPLLTDGESLQSEEFSGILTSGSPIDIATYYAGLTTAQKANLGLVNVSTTGNVSLITDYLIAYDSVYTLETQEQSYINSLIARHMVPVMVNGVINADIDEYRYDLEIQDTYIYSPTLSIVTGASFRRDIVKSKMYFFDDMQNDTTRLFGSATWQATENTNLHIGLMAEKESELDLVIAPRAAINYKLNPSQSVRFVYGEAVRSPDFMEQSANWQLIVDHSTPAASSLNGNVYYQTQQGPGDLDHQRIRSYEVGYYGRYGQLNGELDVRIFHEELTDVYYQPLSITDFSTVRDLEMEFSGVEWQYSFAPWQDTTLRWVGAYIDAMTNNEALDDTLLKIHAKHTHTLTWLEKWGNQTSSSMSYLLVDQYDELSDMNNDTRLERLDAKIIHNIQLPQVGLDIIANIQHDLIDDDYIWNGHVYKDDTRVQLALNVNF